MGISFYLRHPDGRVQYINGDLVLAERRDGTWWWVDHGGERMTPTSSLIYETGLERDEQRGAVRTET